MFSEGREDVNDEERAGRPSTSTTDEKINEVEKMILANRRITVREVAEDLNISIGSCHSIFINDLGMRRVAAKFVPKLLNCDQKQHRMNIANEMLDSVRDDPNLFQRVITGDEAGVVHHEFLPQGRTPPYSPDLASCDFFLFSKLKRPMNGRRYATLDEIKTASKEELKKILKNVFLKCFEDWKNRWHNLTNNELVTATETSSMDYHKEMENNGPPPLESEHASPPPGPTLLDKTDKGPHPSTEPMEPSQTLPSTDRNPLRTKSGRLIKPVSRLNL
ncbi:hypothetical protein LAZ67_23000390 [Cordylochernes scorpioides]|uniref:Uncharacterized protein n=1 Tax=Cordylochernes scorpioides TaxID=51811 RepID=A0ABY6LPY1_9ARAC|nr:hypothetical protein LAZ67_23000390 [Cordylochernes scorpioides]